MNWEVFEGVTDLKSEAIYAILNWFIMHQISFAPKLFLFLFAIFQAQLLPPPQRSTATLRQPPLATPHLKP